MNDAVAAPVSSYYLEAERQNSGPGINLFGVNFGMFFRTGGESITAGAWSDVLRRGGTSNFVAAYTPVETKEKFLQAEFNVRADLWEKETAVFSDPASMYFNKNYMLIITKGIENPKVIVPLILDRLVKNGGDWFFALQKITEQNPAENSTSYESAISAWQDWMSRNL